MLNVELWERFSYYGMRAILLYFITDTVANGGMGFDNNTGQVILAAYGAAVYLLTIPGGIFADRIIGPWPSVPGRPHRRAVVDRHRPGRGRHWFHQAESLNDRRRAV